MSCEGKIYIGQIGALLELETQGADPDCPVVDWSDATSLEIVCLRADKTVVAFPATLFGTKLRYVTLAATDLGVKGNYSMQSHVVGPGYNALGETDSFIVYDKFK